MTDLADIIDARAILPSVKAQGKKQLLQELSQAMAKFVNIDHRIIFETLLQREKLGSTGIGQGIAIPHGKMASINRVYGLFARLTQPIAYDAMDGQPVELPAKRQATASTALNMSMVLPSTTRSPAMPVSTDWWEGRAMTR